MCFSSNFPSCDPSSTPEPLWLCGSTVPSSLSPVVNIRHLIHSVQCQQFKRAQFVFLSSSISVILLWAVRSRFSTCVPSKAQCCVGIWECDCEDDTIFWLSATVQKEPKLIFLLTESPDSVFSTDLKMFSVTLEATWVISNCWWDNSLDCLDSSLVQCGNSLSAEGLEGAASHPTTQEPFVSLLHCLLEDEMRGE